MREKGKPFSSMEELGDMMKEAGNEVKDEGKEQPEAEQFPINFSELNTSDPESVQEAAKDVLRDYVKDLKEAGDIDSYKLAKEIIREHSAVFLEMLNQPIKNVAEQIKEDKPFKTQEGEYAGYEEKGPVEFLQTMITKKVESFGGDTASEAAESSEPAFELSPNADPEEVTGEVVRQALSELGLDESNLEDYSKRFAYEVRSAITQINNIAENKRAEKIDEKERDLLKKAKVMIGRDQQKAA